MKFTEEQYQQILKRQGSAGFSGVSKPAPKRPKYGNTKTISGDKVFPSKHQARRYAELELMQSAGQIRNLQREVPFDLIINGQHICTYICDARYELLVHGGTCAEHWQPVVEDSKSRPTQKKPEYRIKRKLLEALHGITIQEVL